MKNLPLIALLAASLLAAGCQSSARIAWDPPKAAPSEKSVLYVGDLAALDRHDAVWGSATNGESIGKHTFTVFAIPVGNINADPETPVQPSFDHATRDALKAAGYELRPAAEAPKGAPILKGEVRQCQFWSYSWFWPVFVQGGDVKVALRFENADGTSPWSKEFHGSGPGMGFVGSFGFDTMVKTAMNGMVSDITSEFAKPEVRKLAQRI